MDKYEAQDLVRTTLQNPFDKDRFYYLVKNLLNKFDQEATFIYRGKYIPDAYKPYIDTLERVGKYLDSEDNKIDILIVHLKKESSLEYARTMQRNFVAWYLNGSRGGELKDAALVAFVSPDLNDWRFSLVKMEYKITETPSGRKRAKEEFTPAKRFSFLVGLYENSHTAQSRLVPIIQDDVRNPTLTQFEDSFNIEKVTKEFFEKYRELFLKVKETLDEFVKKDEKIRLDFTEKQVSTVDFAKKLLGQIVFLYFLQKKGWFGVERDNDWGTGSKDFLRRLYEKMVVEYDNYFNDILEPLFYEALAKERDDNFYSRFNCKIPFLNGGLFDPIGNYDWVHTDIKLPNDLFSNSYKTKEGDTGTGILDVFDRYNFTVKEDEPLEKEVAVDPEMLGKVFENLLEVKDRKSKGTYYTPREIVHYMCQESLINYLVTECEGKIGKEDIETLIKFGETAVEHDSRVGRNGKETQTYSYKLPESIRKNAELLDEKLKNIRVCDPAIGSGAFPVGMMNEIIRTRNALTNYLKDKSGRTIYDFKRHAIQNCLYGVDIDPGAVEIAKLRLWLSLVVEEEDIKSIKPLPNLDYKIVCGNSLLSVDKQNMFVDFNLRQIEKLKEALFNETSTSKKQEYKEQIDKLITEVTDNNKAFDFEIYFSEAFEDKNKGFDIVIANPPYIGEKGHKELFHEVKKYRLGRFYLGKMDYFYFFFHLAFDIGKNHSQVAFITTNYYITALGAKKLRQDFKERTIIRHLINFNELKIFESARGQHNMVTVLSKDHDEKAIAQNCITKRTGVATAEVLRNILSWNDGETDYYNVSQADLYDSDEFYIRINGNSKIGKNDIVGNILLKISKDSELLGEICSVDAGLHPGVDRVSNKILHKYKGLDLILNEGVFVLSLNEAEKFRSKNYLKPLFKSSDIGQWRVAKNSYYILYSSPHNPINDILFIQHISKFKKILQDVRRINNENIESWKYLRRGVLKERIYTNIPKIVAPYRSQENRFAFNNTQCYGSQDVYFITEKNQSMYLKYILALLNSKLYFLWLYHRGKRKGDILELYQKPLSEIPIKKISPENQKPFIEMVDKILAVTDSVDYLTSLEKQAKVKAYERQIDQMVYKLCGLTPEEISIVEGLK